MTKTTTIELDAVDLAAIRTVREYLQDGTTLQASARAALSWSVRRAAEAIETGRIERKVVS